LAFRHSILGGLLILLLFSFAELRAQTCEGSLGDPVVNIDFGRGFDQYGPMLSSTGYRYVRNTPEDSEYTIASSTTGMNQGWYTVFNHTPGESFGYMMIVNADNTAGKVFYESSAPINLCPNTTYEFAAWIVNILRNPDGKRPNITFSILSMSDQVLGVYNTNDIPNANPVWKQYGFTFRTTGAGQVKIKMVNNGPGGNGNDVALDDITFRACGPKIIAGVDNTQDLVKDLCEGTTASIKFNTTVLGTPTLKYQWQRNIGNGWIDVPGETGSSMTENFSGKPLGKYDYRLAVAEPGNFNSPICRTSSPVMTVMINPYPVPQAIANGPVCLGTPIILDVTGATGTYEWTGPDGRLISTEQSPSIPNSTYAMAGTYTVKVNSRGCVASGTVEVTIIPPPVASVANTFLETCEGLPVQLSASGGTYYSWTPSTGLSATDIANPVAKPLVTTVYSVNVYRGNCFSTATVEVKVNKAPKADAGQDRQVLLGDTVTLSGKVSGDGVDFFWTPNADIDNARLLNPVVSPKITTTYTLNVVSSLGCVTATDEVLVTVYQKVTVPNAFSPNGDAVNDTWNITALELFEGADIKVMNRYGELVFQRTGYLKPWDGKYQNKDLPAGVYYYVIQLQSDMKPISGSVTIIR